MTYININNGAGANYYSDEAREALQALKAYGLTLDAIVEYMDDDAREAAHATSPDDDIEFLTRYLEIASTPLIIG